MVINLHRNQIWALGTEVVTKQIGRNKTSDTNTNKTSSITRCLNEDTEDADSKPAKSSNDVEENKRVHISTMNDEEATESISVETTYESDMLDDFPNVESPV